MVANFTFNWFIDLVGRVFANGPGDWGSISGWVIPKTLKIVLDTSLLNTHHYKVRIKGIISLDILIQSNIFPTTKQPNTMFCPVGWVCWIHRLLLCRGVRPSPLNECPGYDTKQSDGEALVMLELWRMWSTPSLPPLPGPL